jgi:hypothetical protein
MPQLTEEDRAKMTAEDEDSSEFRRTIKCLL